MKASYAITIHITTLSIFLAHAAVIVTEDFTYADGALAGKSGGTGSWGGAWAGGGSVASGQNSTAGGKLWHPFHHHNL